MPKKTIEIIHQDAEKIVINKPSGIAVTADRSGAEDIIPILTRQLNPAQDLRLVYRMDKSASGALVIAKTPEVQSRLASWFEKRLIKRTCLAIVTGVITKEKATIRTPIARCRRDPRIMISDPKRGKPALTHYRVLADFGLYALLAVQPETGRTHQVRVHLAGRSLPLAIDPLYGDSKPILLSDFKPRYVVKKQKTETPLIDRLSLHTYQLEIPVEGGQPDVYVAGVDKKFAAAVKMLAKHNPKGVEAFIDPDNLSKIINAEPL